METVAKLIKGARVRVIVCLYSSQYADNSSHYTENSSHYADIAHTM